MHPHIYSYCISFKCAGNAGNQTSESEDSAKVSSDRSGPTVASRDYSAMITRLWRSWTLSILGIHNAPYHRQRKHRYSRIVSKCFRANPIWCCLLTQLFSRLATRNWWSSAFQSSKVRLQLIYILAPIIFTCKKTYICLQQMSCLIDICFVEGLNIVSAYPIYCCLGRSGCTITSGNEPGSERLVAV